MADGSNETKGFWNVSNDLSTIEKINETMSNTIMEVDIFRKKNPEK